MMIYAKENEFKMSFLAIRKILDNHRENYLEQSNLNVMLEFLKAKKTPKKPTLQMCTINTVLTTKDHRYF